MPVEKLEEPVAPQLVRRRCGNPRSHANYQQYRG
jgi:hypothetical protein